MRRTIISLAPLAAALLAFFGVLAYVVILRWQPPVG